MTAITECLYSTDQGIVAYRDSEELPAWWLRELARVTELRESTRKPKILPIFYDVTPTDVKLRTELNSETIEHDLKQVVLQLRGNKRTLGSKLVSWEVGQTSGVDDGSVRRRITSWTKGKLLGKGSFGEVYQALTNDGFSFAVKEVSLVGCKQSLMNLEQEISLLSQLQHDNIVQYYGTKKDDEKLYLYLELMTKGSLETLYKRDKLSHSQVSAYVRQILNGLKYLHDQSVAHRDIKCANVLLDASESVKLADFGLAKVIKMNDANSFKGSAYWMAPEVCNSQNNSYGLAADIWSLGCTVLEMLTCQHPYPDLEGQQALYKLFKGELPPVPDILPRDAQDFILRCLQVDPDERPSAAELLNDPFVVNTSSIVRGQWSCHAAVYFPFERKGGNKDVDDSTTFPMTSFLLLRSVDWCTELLQDLQSIKVRCTRDS